MFDLKVINSVLTQLEEERGIPKEKILEAIEMALATAYKKEYGKKGQIVRAHFDIGTGTTDFYQVKIVVDESRVILEDEEEKKERAEKLAAKKGAKGKDGKLAEEKAPAPQRDMTPGALPNAIIEDERTHFNPEHHILLADAKRIKKDVELDEEMIFPLEMKDDYGRIAAQTAKQVIIQKIREAEKVSVLAEYGKRQGEIVSGTIQRVERGTIFVDLGRTNGVLPYEEQIPGERYKQGERIRAYLITAEESPKGIFLKLSRAHPKFLQELFKIEAPEIAAGIVEIKAVAREAGSRSKVAVMSHDNHIDPIGSMVGQRGVRVSTVTSELGGEKIDIIEWSADPKKFIEDSLSPAKVQAVELDEKEMKATVRVAEDQQSLAIGKGGQNVRLAAKLTGWKIDIQSIKTETAPVADEASSESTPEAK